MYQNRRFKQQYKAPLLQLRILIILQVISTKFYLSSIIECVLRMRGFNYLKANFKALQVSGLTINPNLAHVFQTVYLFWAEINYKIVLKL